MKYMKKGRLSPRLCLLPPGYLLRLSCMLGLLGAACLLLAACGGRDAGQGGDIFIYGINQEETRIETRAYTPGTVSGKEGVEELLQELKNTPENLEYRAPLGMGFGLNGYSLESGILYLDMDEEYKELTPTTEVLVRAALVMTLTQLEDVELVGITVGGSPLYDSSNTAVGLMSEEQFVDNTSNDINTYEKVKLRLYFANEAGDRLIAVIREKPYNTNSSMEKLIVEELIKGPLTEGLYPVINPETKVLSVSTKDGICYVNLSEEFLTRTYNVTADVVIFSIVNSLSEQANINKVQISIEGETTGTFQEKYPFSTVFGRNLDLIATE